MSRIVKVLTFFTLTIIWLVALASLIILTLVGGPYLAGYVAGLFGLGALAELIITGFLFMVIPAGMITYVKFND